MKVEQRSRIAVLQCDVEGKVSTGQTDAALRALEDGHPIRLPGDGEPEGYVSTVRNLRARTDSRLSAGD